MSVYTDTSMKESTQRLPKMEVGEFVTFKGVIYVIKKIDRGSVFMVSYEAMTQEQFAAECTPVIIQSSTKTTSSDLCICEHPTPLMPGDYRCDYCGYTIPESRRFEPGNGWEPLNPASKQGR